MVDGMGCGTEVYNAKNIITQWALVEMRGHSWGG